MNTKYQYEYEWDSNYCYPNTFILQNKLDLRDEKKLNAAERALTVLRLADLENQAIPGNLDLVHLQQIHRFLFQDVYDWAGKLRTVNIAKGNLFCNWNYIVSGSTPIFDRLKSEKYLIGTSPDGICDKLAYYLGEINVIHPFREGNGRTQRVFIQYLARAAGYHVDFTSISSNEMVEASALAFDCDYRKMAALFEKITEPIPTQEQENFIHSIAIEHSSILAVYEAITADQEVELEQTESPQMKF